jgi:hypothetical protein
MRIAFLFTLLAGTCISVTAQSGQKTFCNPVNIDYGYTPIPGLSTWGRHRATADPVIVNYHEDYYLFSTNQWGYWESPDLMQWNFHERRFLRSWNTGYDELCAPAVGIIGDTMLVFGSTYTGTFTIWMSTDPKANQWKPLVDSFEIGGWDPAFFTDSDGRLFMYNGSSNRWPLFGIELDRKTMQPIGAREPLFFLDPWRYGWQRFGEHMDNTFLDPFAEGAWMTEHDGKYYLQYGAPGTEFSGYADGVTVGSGPLGPFTPQSDPLSFKPGGFARGAGHGATFRDNWGNYWHTSTIILGVRNNFERRIGIWPAGFDKEGVMYCNTAFGDYPHLVPSGSANHLESRFSGWMLLNYQKPTRTSSAMTGHPANLAVDESMRTYWSASSGGSGEWLESDLGMMSTVYAIQINYADQNVDSTFLGKLPGLAHQYRIHSSCDGKIWDLLVDKSENDRDVPHDYVELSGPVTTRYIRIENVQIPTGYFALSGFRVFGLGTGAKPPPVRDLLVLRTEKDKRSAWLRWRPVDEAYAYQLYYGTDRDKLYNTIMVYDANEYWFKGMDSEESYYYTIEALNENGISVRTDTIRAD